MHAQYSLFLVTLPALFFLSDPTLFLIPCNNNDNNKKHLIEQMIQGALEKRKKENYLPTHLPWFLLAQ